MSFYSFFFIIAIVLLIQTETAHANFLCNDNGSEKNKAAKLGYCLRAIKPKDHTDPRITADLTHKYWFVALARHVGPNPEEFTCEGRSVVYGKKEKDFLLPPSSSRNDTCRLQGRLYLYYQEGLLSSRRKVFQRQRQRQGGKGGKGGNGGKVQG
ncbi:hypothetical protein PSHT_12304 [Puccinia striiformis]|uniref:Secreted protein n=1 Tax=Puccinia striiformis TaxID=27350 RepID=A0A2S4UXF3_9BASI|nr:hypothetical protein PSHT_12304 [Puccinia striiformis]